MNRIRIVGLSIACVVGLVACASRPSEQELTDAIIAAVGAEPTIDLSADQARCMAKELLAGNLSDTTLSGLAKDFDNPEVLKTELDDVEPQVSAAANVCRP